MSAETGEDKTGGDAPDPQETIADEEKNIGHDATNEEETTPLSKSDDKTPISRQIILARENSSGPGDFLLAVFRIFMQSVSWVIFVGLFIVVPIAMIVIGSLKLHECPAGPKIPVYLIVGGTASIITQLLTVVQKTSERSLSHSHSHSYSHRIEDRRSLTRAGGLVSLINCFMTIWFIVGCVWVYGIYKPSYDPAAGSDYCNATIYLFAFWLLTSTFIIGAAMIALGFITIFITLCCVP